jgi:hypothetical protein
VDVTPTRPGQGLFTSGGQTGPGMTPAPTTSLSFIDRFPVVRISGRFKGKRTKFQRVTVNGPRGRCIRVACKCRGCVTHPGKIGKYIRVRTRKSKAPLRIDCCLIQGRTRPVKCPTA